MSSAFFLIRATRANSSSTSAGKLNISCQREHKDPAPADCYSFVALCRLILRAADGLLWNSGPVQSVAISSTFPWWHRKLLDCPRVSGGIHRPAYGEAENRDRRQKEGRNETERVVQLWRVYPAGIYILVTAQHGLRNTGYYIKRALDAPRRREKLPSGPWQITNFII